ncbi:unnamed protein product [Cylindrotheca closterium]|uniref:Rad50/SbcC-type AAA domain-containing protein n=1 Tax=Cylindrotheca closterium TaxID=2856 RepID=A0AAD2CEZ8_9STRA|nr:unnamed protein product [Cylindrotheca closterium]
MWKVSFCSLGDDANCGEWCLLTKLKKTCPPIPLHDLGRTTIIESLKFAVCGALPPGNKSGQAFVHDPNSIGQSSVKAQIKLRFTNRGGRTMVVLRSMELAQKKKNMTFKQLDGVIRMTDEDGQRQSLSHKCSELDRQLPVHQEDANWPLQEGAVLKKRFDDIFDSTRYTKALEVFSKLKKDYTSKVKDHKADVASYSSHLHAAQGFQAEVEKYSDQLELVEQEIEENTEELRRTENEEKRLNEILDQLDEIQLDVDDKSNSLHTLTELANKTRKMLEDDLTEEKSARELKEMLRDFDSKLNDQIDEMDDLQGEISRLKNQISELTQEESKLQSQLGRYQAEKDAQVERQTLRCEKVIQGNNRFGLNSTLTAFSQSQSMTQNASFLEASGQPVQLEMSKTDLDDYFRALGRKTSELDEDLNRKTKLRLQSEDESQSQLVDLKGKLQSIKNEQKKLNHDIDEAKKEYEDVSRQVSQISRMRKDDVEDARNNANRLAAQRDKLNKDPRRSQIATEIRSFEDKSDRLKRDLEEDSDALRDLRETAEAQHEITVLKQQIARDIEDLKESIQESDFALKSRNIDIPTIELDGDEIGDGLSQAMGKLTEDVSSKFQIADSELRKAREQFNALQNVVAEKSALLTRDQQLVHNKRDKLASLSSEGGIKKVENVVSELRQFEASNAIATPPELNETKPKELLTYLEERLEAEEAESLEGIQPEVISKIIKRLKNKAKRPGQKVVCPCCKRGLDDQDSVQVFSEQMKMLMGSESPLLKDGENNKTAKSQYQKWRRITTENMNDILEYRRIANEVNDIEHNCTSLETVVEERKEDLETTKTARDEILSEVDGLRSLLESCKMWQGASDRINLKRSQAMNKCNTLSISESVHSGRDLKTVERDFAEKTEKKDEYQEKISRLNKEMTKINNQMSSVSKQATDAENLAREKEEKFAGIRKLSDRKKALNERISKTSKELLELGDNIKPIKDKIAKKESEREKMRKHTMEEENEIRKTTEQLKMFENEFRELQRQIDDFDSRNEVNALERIENQIEGFQSKRKEKEANVAKIQPHLERLKKALDDQERHKKNLNENINLLDLNAQIRDLERELENLQEGTKQIKGRDTAKDDIDNLQRRKNKLAQQNARLEGRRGEIHENIRSFKRKLSQPEYRSVDEEYRIASIKHDTTEMAVRDIGKYHAALDKALQRFHSLKIAEINTIIRDLWNLTYKGEDITSIALVSGKDTGSRSTRSYNYRVVMTKGTTELDMRGRCSAGQRVLASIVIRLALAETFCVNCGCIALDEPTVNLDYRNKKGLAVALAQIIASRAKQRNFQLIMITHDEDFVAIMKTELASQTGFSMPEKYFQVRREEGADGKFYSKIDAIDWEELV